MAAVYLMWLPVELSTAVLGKGHLQLAAVCDPPAGSHVHHPLCIGFVYYHWLVNYSLYGLNWTGTSMWNRRLHMGG